MILKLKAIAALSLMVVFVSSCSTASKLTYEDAYKGIYNEAPLTVLIMPPINKSTNVESKEFFHSTLNVPLANAGYYIIPPFLSMEILRNESAYDAELFLNQPVNKFGEVFGADVALFTIIHRWDKSSIGAKVLVSVEYILKSTKTNEVLYQRKGDVTYDASVSTNVGGIWGAIADLALSAVNTAATKYVDVARVCNTYTFKSMPTGKYHPQYLADLKNMAGQKDFKIALDSRYQ